MKNWFLECHLLVLQSIRTYVPSPTPERLCGFYSYSVFKSFSVIDRCLVKTSCDYFYYISIIYGDHLPN